MIRVLSFIVQVEIPDFQ